MVKPTFVKGDLVFAQVKGYPAWPVRITSHASFSETFRVLFYGTFEKGNIKKTEIRPYTLDRIISRGRATVKVFIRLKIPQRLLPLMEKMFQRTVFFECVSSTFEAYDRQKRNAHQVKSGSVLFHTLEAPREDRQFPRDQCQYKFRRNECFHCGRTFKRSCETSILLIQQNKSK